MYANQDPCRQVAATGASGAQVTSYTTRNLSKASCLLSEFGPWGKMSTPQLLTTLRRARHMQLYTNSEGGKGGGGAGEAANAPGASQQQQTQQQPQQQPQQHNRHLTAAASADDKGQSPFEHAFAQHANPPAKAEQAAGQQQTTSTAGKRNFLFPSFCHFSWYSPTTACWFLQNVGTPSPPREEQRGAAVWTGIWRWFPRLFPSHFQFQGFVPYPSPHLKWGDMTF